MLDGEELELLVVLRSAMQPNLVVKRTLLGPRSSLPPAIRPNNPRLPPQSLWTMEVAAWGKRVAIMGSALAHDAQNAAGAILTEDRNPSPPILMDSVANV